MRNSTPGPAPHAAARKLRHAAAATAQTLWPPHHLRRRRARIEQAETENDEFWDHIHQTPADEPGFIKAWNANRRATKALSLRRKVADD